MTIARVLPSISDGTGLGLDYQELIDAGVHVPEFIDGDLDADFFFDKLFSAPFRSRVSPFEFDTEGNSDLILEDNSAGRYLRIEAGQSGLQGPTKDSLEWTYGAVVNYRLPTSINIVAGTKGDTPEDGGENIRFHSDGTISMQIESYGEGASATPRFSPSDLSASGISPSNNSFIFVCATSRLTGGPSDETEHTLFIGGSPNLIKSKIGVKVLSENQMAVGNAYRSHTSYLEDRLRIARFFSGPGYRTPEEMDGMYRRAKVIADRRGVSVR